MEDLTVISGSGEQFQLSLPEGSLMEQSVAAIRKALELPPEICRKETAAILKGFFPSRYRSALENLSHPDVRRLASAFALLLKNSRAEDPAVQLPLPFDSAESFSSASSGKISFPEKKPSQEKTITSPSRKQEQSPLLFPEFSVSEESPSDTEEKNKHFSDDVIAAAFFYKWTLEYAASLTPELLKRCLAAAGREFRPKRIRPAEEVSAEEIADAVRRGREALARLKKQ